MYTTLHITHTFAHILTSLKIYLILVLSILLVSCGGGGGGDQEPIIDNMRVTAQVGVNSSTVHITNPNSDAYTLYVSNTRHCDTTNPGVTCNETQNIPANDSTEFTTTSLTLSTPLYGLLETTADTISFSISVDKFSTRYGHQVVVKGDTMYLIGGYDNSSSYKNDVWQSADGETWTQVTENAGFTPRENHQVVVLGEDMYLIGGVDNSHSYRNDVWKSSDSGKNWTQISVQDNTLENDTKFTPREDHQVVVMGDTMYLIGGSDNSKRFNDVWKSTNGANWTQVPKPTDPNSIFSERDGHQVVVMGDTMYLIGGSVALDSFKNDVWKFTNEETWEIVTENAGFAPRESHQVVVIDNTMYVIGGNNGDGVKNDIWKSTNNGKTWEVLTGSQVNAGQGHQVVVMNKVMYLIGTIDTSDLWKSADGVNWTQLTTYYTPDGFTKFAARQGHQVVAIDDALYVIGGLTNDGRQKDVWKSTNSGETWTQITSDAEFAGRWNHQVVVIGDTLYLIGGQDGFNSYKNDVWQSTNSGKTWEKVTENAGFTPRANHQVVVMDDTLYLIGGRDKDVDDSDSDRFRNDVWKSTTQGLTWEQLPNAPFAPREDHQVVVMGDTMYLIGGSVAPDSYKNDVWKFTDEETWEKVTETAGFTPRANHQVVVMGNTLYLIGGEDDSTRFNDVWESTNSGKTWRQVDTASTLFTPRDSHQVVVMGGTLYVIGGYDNSSSYKNDVWNSSDGRNWFLNIEITIRGNLY